MTVQRREILLQMACAATAIACASRASAEPYPSRPIRILVGFPRGGPLDIVARTVAPLLSNRLGASVLVENRPGESGNIATAELVKAAPDGHTLLLCGPVNVINASLFENIGFDFLKDVKPVAFVATVPLVIEVNPSVPVRSVPELLAFVRRDPGRLRIAFAGVGTPQHIAIEMFQLMVGVKVTMVPYAGSASALEAVLAGEADAMFDPAPSSMPHVRAGRLVPLATTGSTRAAMLPDVPALSEFVSGYEASSWFGIGAPRDTSDRIVDLLNRAVCDSLADDRVRGRFRELGATIMLGSSERFGRFIALEADRYRRVIEAARMGPAAKVSGRSGNNSP